MTTVITFVLTVLLHIFRLNLTAEVYSIVVNIIGWSIFGALLGIVLYRIKPDQQAGGYIGAAFLGSSGALLGGIIATTLYEALQTMNLVLLVVFLMTLSSLFLSVSNIFLHRDSFSS